MLLHAVRLHVQPSLLTFLNLPWLLGLAQAPVHLLLPRSLDISFFLYLLCPPASLPTSLALCLSPWTESLSWCWKQGLLQAYSPQEEPSRIRVRVRLSSIIVAGVRLRTGPAFMGLLVLGLKSQA